MAIKVTGNIVITDAQAIANITTISANGNANVGNIGAGTAELTTGNITTINSGLLQNGNSNIVITAGGNVTLTARTVSSLVVSNTGANVTGTFNATGNANVNNLGTAQVLATANVTAPQLISNVATGTAPLLVSSTTVVANLNSSSLQGNTPSQTATANSIAQRNADGNITANFYIGNGSQLTGVTASVSFPLANGTSNIDIPTASGNINFSIGGSANEVVFTSTGVNVAGTINATDVITGNGSGLSALNAGNISTGTLAVGRGGLGITTTPTNGQIPIGNGTTYVAAAITGTTDQITVTNGAGTITLSTPQSINTTSNPQFNSLGVGTAGSATAGEIRATNNITAYYSDDRLKTRLGMIEEALNKIKQLNGFYYTASELAESLGYTKKREVGLSAQEVQKVLPEVVTTAPIDDKYLTIWYEKVIPLLVEGIKELAIEVDYLKKYYNGNFFDSKSN